MCSAPIEEVLLGDTNQSNIVASTEIFVAPQWSWGRRGWSIYL